MKNPSDLELTSPESSGDNYEKQKAAMSASAPGSDLQLPRRELAVSAEPTIGEIMRDMVKAGVTGENVAAFKELVALKRELEKDEAQKQFNAAFVKLQSELPTIVAKSIIPNRGKYEKHEDIMEAIRIPLDRNGFTAEFSQELGDGRVTETCCLRHRGGYSKTNAFTVRTGRKADNDTQADCMASTTAKRMALVNALNLVIRQDVLQSEEGDASLEGAFIAPDKAQYLRERVKELGGNEAAFLATAGAKSYEEICNGSYAVLTRMLDAKERAKK